MGDERGQACSLEQSEAEASGQDFCYAAIL